MIRVANQPDDAVALGREQPRESQRDLSVGTCNRHVHGASWTSRSASKPTPLIVSSLALAGQVQSTCGCRRFDRADDHCLSHSADS